MLGGYFAIFSTGNTYIPNIMREIIIILLLILLNGFFALAEIALISVRKSSLSGEAKKGNKSAKRALKLSDNPDIFLSTVQIGITLIGILTGIYSGDLLADRFAKTLSSIGIEVTIAYPIAQVTIIIVVTYLTLIFGELLPKRIGMSMAEKVAKKLSTPMLIISYITKPFVWILAKSTSLLFNLFGINKGKTNITEAEIRSIIAIGTAEGIVQPMEQDIMERVFLLGDLKVASIMTNRSDIISMGIDFSRNQVREVLEKEMHEIYPVINNSLDDIVGIISLKELILNLEKPNFEVANIVSQPVSFHENMSVYNALESMKSNGRSRALVFDEFGVCQGIVTSKDILEALVGLDSDPSELPDIIKRPNGEGWLADGQCAFYDFLLYFDMEDEYTKERYQTISGLIITELQKIPTVGEKINWKNFSFEVVDMDGVRIDKILITKIAS